MVKSLPTRVQRAAEELLAEHRIVRPVEVLVRLGWLADATVERWQRGRFSPLESVMQTTRLHHTAALAELEKWARSRGLRPTETTVSALPGRSVPRFSADADPGLERAVYTHWYSPDLPEPEQEIEKPSKPPELVVVSATRSWECAHCQTPHEPGQFLIMEDAGPVCLSCADLDHLEYLPAGNTALTRRAKRGSRLHAVVVRWSRSRRRYERQGMLVEAAALEQAEADCLADAEVRERRRARAAERQPALDEQFMIEFAAAIRDQFPGCPPDRAEHIARHTGQRSSGRVGRTAAGRSLDPEAVRAAVVAAIRHEDTDYDRLLTSGVDRGDARDLVYDQVQLVLDSWQQAGRN